MRGVLRNSRSVGLAFLVLLIGRGSPVESQVSPPFEALSERLAKTTDAEEAYGMAQELLEMAKGSGETQELVNAYIQLARTSRLAGRARDAIQHADQGFAVLGDRYPSSQARQALFNEKAVALDDLGRVEEALLLGEKSYGLASSQGEPGALLQATQFIANLHGRIGNHAEALGYHLRSLKAFALEDTFPRLQVLNNVILTLTRMGDLDRAMAYSNQAEELRHSASSSDPRFSNVSAPLLLNRANLLRFRGEYREQLKVLEEADRLARAFPNEGTRALITGAMADAYINLEDYDQAAEVSRRALADTDPENSPYPHAIAMANLGLALSRSGNPKGGVEYLVRSRDILERIQSRAEALEVQGLAAEAYEEAGDLAAAVREYKRLKEATDEFRQGQLESRLVEAQAEFDLALSQKEVDLLETEQKVQALTISRQRQTLSFFAVGLLGVLLITGLVWNRYRLKNRAYESLAEAHARLDRALDEVKQLQEMLPICANCKNVRDDQGLWNQIETYISKHSQTRFSHTLCPDCARDLYPEETADLDLK